MSQTHFTETVNVGQMSKPCERARMQQKDRMETDMQTFMKLCMETLYERPGNIHIQAPRKTTLWI